MVAVASLSLLAVYTLPANAVHDTGRFQLDGDAASSTQAFGPPATDDWNNVCHEVTVTKDTTNSITDECTGSSDTTSSTAVSWTAEPDHNATIFTSGGSKDPQDISNWLWKDGAGGLPDKDNLLHSFAVRYSLPPDRVDTVPPGSGDLGNGTACPSGGKSTCELLFFGSDRFDNSGDAQQGFWFFQNRITTGGSPAQGGTKFTGVHKNGDILVISDFSNGGTTSTITVYRWDDSCKKAGGTASDGTPCGDANLAQLETSTNAKCAATLGAGDAFCGIVNPSTKTMPWAFVDKSGTPNNGALNGEFYEGGINLSLLPGNIANECFSSVASETRSSTSTTATLKDFILGNFGECTAKLETQVSSASVNPSTAVHDTATVTGNQSNITPTGTVTFFLCSFAAGSTDVCDDSDSAHHGTSIGTGTLSGSGKVATADSPDVNTAASPLDPGRYCFRAEWPGDTNYTTALKEFSGATECFVVLQSSTTTVTEPQLASDNSAITSPVAVNTHVVDHALITGATGFGTPTGSVKFYICNPSQVSGTGSNATCPDPNGTQVGSAVTATAVANSSPPQSEATSSPDVVANTVGVWCFRAVYTPDTAKYTGSSDANHNECFTVQDSSSVTTAQDWLPNDSATVTATGGTALNGTLTFQLYTGDNCGATSGAAVANQQYTRTLTNATTPADRTKSTGNTDYKVTATAKVSWLVTFTSTDGNVTSPSSSTCESSDLTITN